LPFAPEIVLPTIAHCDRLHPLDAHPYGFKATFNQTCAFRPIVTTQIGAS
jgi:hypothetical protein